MICVMCGVTDAGSCNQLCPECLKECQGNRKKFYTRERLDKLTDDLKGLEAVWGTKKNEPFRDTVESLVYAWCANDLNKIIEKHKNPEGAE